MKKYLIYILLILSPLTHSLAYSSSPATETQVVTHRLWCCPELRNILTQIRSLPEGNALVNKILEEGPLTIKLNKNLSKEFNGYWDGDKRTVFITYSKSTSIDVLFPTLLFELHNASRNQDFGKLDYLAHQRQMSKQEYVRSVEYIEFENVQAVTQLLQKGKAQGLYPQSIEWNFSNDFEKHFYVQQKTGHSAWIAKGY